ncbi:hypothetical protein [Henriciella aquimarina]|uniref:hypothetical protein n=1 Tax=Henriciella aquimarina TaxID=545261 RepID=UPI000A00E931|nr:hypothetical protein [Henriciella aquimarina]
MTSYVSFPAVQGTPPVQSASAPVVEKADAGDIGKRFEEMLWAQMLSHAGLEKAFTQSGGQAAASFSQFMVEAIAKDLAERHPLGLDPLGHSGASGAQAEPVDVSTEDKMETPE